MSMIVSGTKAVGEVTPITFDFISKLASSETILSGAATVTVWSGIDANPQALVSGTPTVSGTKVVVTLTGGQPGCIYKIACAATTNASTIYIISTVIPVVNDPL